MLIQLKSGRDRGISWLLRFLGHAVDGKPPAFFTNWHFLLGGPKWWVAKFRGQHQASPLLSPTG